MDDLVTLNAKMLAEIADAKRDPRTISATTFLTALQLTENVLLHGVHYGPGRPMEEAPRDGTRILIYGRLVWWPPLTGAITDEEYDLHLARWDFDYKAPSRGRKWIVKGRDKVEDTRYWWPLPKKEG